MAWADGIGNVYNGVGGPAGYFAHENEGGAGPPIPVAAARHQIELPDDCAVTIEQGRWSGIGWEEGNYVECWLCASAEVWEEAAPAYGWRLQAFDEGSGFYRLRLSLWYEGVDLFAMEGEVNGTYGAELTGVELDPLEEGGWAIGAAIKSDEITLWARAAGGEWEEREGAQWALLEVLPDRKPGIGTGGWINPQIRNFSAGSLEGEEEQPPPSVVEAPQLSGKAVVDETLACSNGTWENEPTGFTYKWQRSATGTGGWANIGGATSSTYKLTDDDDQEYVRCVVTASNPSGSAEAASNVLWVEPKAGLYVKVGVELRPIVLGVG
jgi:hypothetical protein